MTRNAETPDTPAPDGFRSGEAAPPEDPRASQEGPVAELGLAAAGLGLVVYLIGFVEDLGGSSSLVLPLLLGGGLLAGTVALPAVGGRVLAPAAVATTTGALLLLRVVVDDGGGSALEVGALVLGLLEAAAVVGATLMQSGVLRSRPPKARKASAFSGHPAGPQFPGQQYPGQPFPGAYPGDGRPTEPSAADQWTGEHAYGQNARYGGQYGVPGYPPPPPYAVPGYDPAPRGAEPPTIAVATEASGDAVSPPRGTHPVTEPVADAGNAGSGYRSPADPGTGAHRAHPDQAAALFQSTADAATGTGSHRAVPDPAAFRTAPEGTGSYRAAPGTGSFAARTTPASGTGAHRSASSDRPSDDDEHTRAIPAVPDDPRP